ncbi:MAG: hypothetical protein PHI35_03290 [Victivallaceae bacterium]|nr:hypothetical protein [Victivallaceae bacterium]
MYEVKGNQIIRDGEIIAEIDQSGSLSMHPAYDNYRMQTVAVLKKAGRRAENGGFVYNPDEIPQGNPPATLRESISTVRDLADRIAAANGETAPAMSKMWGDEDPEIWAYIRRNSPVYQQLRNVFDICIKHNHMED